MADELENDVYPVAVVDDEEDFEPTPLEVLLGFIESGNIAEDMDVAEIGLIQNEVLTGYKADKASRSEWEAELEAIHDILKSNVEDTKTYPWPDASNIKYPLLLSSVLQFNARAYPALINDRNVIKCSTFGDDPDGEKKRRADRLSEALNYQILESMDNWTSDMDSLTTTLPVDGVVFKKVWFDESTQKVQTRLILAMDFIVNNNVKDLVSAPRTSELIGLFPYEIRERENKGIYIEDKNNDTSDYEGKKDPNQGDEIDVVSIVEQHTRIDMDEDGYAEPYVVTFEEESGRILSIVANYTLDDIEADDEGNILSVKAQTYYIKYPFFQSVDGSFYNKGIGSLLKPINDSVSSILNQLVDSGHLANTGGGFVDEGLRLSSGTLRFSPGQWKKVNTSGASLRDSFFPLPVREPSNVLFSLLGLLIDAGKDISSIQDVMTGGGDPKAPVGTTLALIEQGTKVYSAVLKRIYRSMKEEFKLIFALDSVYGDAAEYAEILDDPEADHQIDFNPADFDVSPAADPAMITDVQKAAKAQFLMQLAPPPPLDSEKLWVEGLTVAGIENPEDYLLPPPEGPSFEQKMEIARMEIDSRKVAVEEAQLGLKTITAHFDNLKTTAQIGKITAETDEKGGDPTAITETAMIAEGIESNVRKEPRAIGPVEGGPSPVSGAPEVPQI